MTTARLLALFDATARPDDLTPLLDTARARGMHVSALVIGQPPRLPTYIYGTSEVAAWVPPENWQAEIAAETEAASDRASALESRLAEEQIGADVSILVADLPGQLRELGRRALTADLVVFDPSMRSEPEGFASLLRAALFETPAGVLLNPLARPLALQPETVLLAWTPGLPATRAVRAALPLLREAREIRVAMIDPDMTVDPRPGAELAEWLSHHGCAVTLDPVPSGGREIGSVLRGRAVEAGADLVVMGAYDHSRLMQTMFGGTTRSMVEQTELPVLLAH